MDRKDRVTLTLPNDTTLTLEGDADVIKQVLRELDGIKIEYRTHDKQKPL